jgi:hypothetical protein
MHNLAFSDIERLEQNERTVAWKKWSKNDNFRTQVSGGLSGTGASSLRNVN